MKISTGLVPKLHDIQRYPQRSSRHVDLTMQEATVTLALPSTLKVLETYALTFETSEDTQESPRGTVVSTMLVTSKPKFTRHHFELSVIEDLGTDHLADRIAYAYWQENAPDDAVKVVEPVSYAGYYKVSVTWWEVEL